MLLSSTGFSMDMHFCQDQIKGISFMSEAESCHKETAAPACHNTDSKTACHEGKSHCENDDSKTSISKDDCCHNETVSMDNVDADYSIYKIDIQKQALQIRFVTAFVAVYILHYNEEINRPTYFSYSPPLLHRDRQILFQSFLI